MRGRTQARCACCSSGLRAAVEAELVVLWNEGAGDERVEIVPLRFEPGVGARVWTIRGRTLSPQ